jgi:DNA (cytosine-5)-methyltransferase 1
MTATTEFEQLVYMSGLHDEEIADRLGCDARTIRRQTKGQSGVDEDLQKGLRAIVAERFNRDQSKPKTFRFIDLFAGIGGMRYGFEDLGGECIFTSERDKYARMSYGANFPDPDAHLINTDIREITSPREQIGEFDLLLAGFPCQPFSLAGVSKKNALGRPHGFDCEDQGNLFFDIARILSDCQPRAFLLENVKNLKSHDKGKTFATIKSILEGESPEFPDINFHLDIETIDAKAWVPQHRERIFIVGFNKKYFDEVPDFNLSDIKSYKPRVMPTLSKILHETQKWGLESRFVDSLGDAHKKYQLSDHLWEYLQGYAKKHAAKGNGFGFGLVTPEMTSRTLSARYHKDGAEILVDQKHLTGENVPPRRLTPQECGRLLGFESRNRRWTFSSRISDTQLYRQFGNAVVVPVVEAIAEQLVPVLTESITKESRKQSAA